MGGVSFHTFTLPEDRCVRLLVKNLGRGMPESVVREELESLNIRVLGVMQLRSGRRDQDPAKDSPPTSHFIVSVARGPEVSKVQSLTELCGLRVSVESYVAPKGPLQYKRCQHFGHTQRNCGYAPRYVACGGSHTRREFLSDLWAGHPNHQPIQPIRYPRCLGHRVNPEPLIPSVSDFVLSTKLGPPPGTH
jgi:hypothetical protein